MKKIYLAIALTVAFASCNNSVANNNQEEKETVKEVTNNKLKGNTMELNVQEFKNKVFNYEVNHDKFVFEGDKPAVVDFYATWCGPCKMVAPIMDEMAQKYNGKVDFYKIDVDKQQELSRVFGIRSIPTLLFIPKNGKPTIINGAMGKGDMDARIKELLLQ